MTGPGLRRVVSLVPSLTEGLATVDPGALVGVTDWCTHPPDLGTRDRPEPLVRVRGTKNPNLALIRELRPDVVIANKEENRELDVRRLREGGDARASRDSSGVHQPLRVEVTEIETVPDAIATYEHLFDDVLGWPRPGWLAEARKLWCGPLPPVTRRVAVAIWRDPWMVVGRDTFTGDLLRRLGWENVFADAADRYPHTTLADIEAAAPDAVLLPDEPYVFTAEDGPEAIAVPTELVSGRLLTWYGPSLLEAARLNARHH